MEKSKEKRRSGCFWVFFVGIVLILMLSLTINLAYFFSSFRQDEARRPGGTRPVDQFPDFRVTWSYGHGDTVVARIPLQGLIIREAEGGLFTPRFDRVQTILDQIRQATNDEKVRGIILEVDSPGGAVTPSDEIYHALRQFRASDDDRRIVVFTRDMAASGAYYAAMAGDVIVAEPTAIIGSVGVMIQTLNWQELSSRIGIRDTTIKSGESKDMLNPFRTTTEEEIAILQTLVDSMFERFLGIVKEGRGWSAEQLERVADGRVFTATDALAEDLIDAVGYWDEAAAMMANLLDVRDLRVIRYERRTDWSDWLFSLRSPLEPWTTALPSPDRPRMMYLWRP